MSAIYIAMSGLQGFEEGLRTIANNTANMNTPGFKGSSLQFADMFAAHGGLTTGTHGGSQGFGLTTVGTRIDFRQGQLQNTGNDLDLAVDGEGLFTLRTDDGALRYTRAGQFRFDADGVLVSSSGNATVMGRDATGTLVPVSIAAAKTSPAKATTKVEFSGNLPTGATTQTVGGITVFDAAGTSYTLSARLDAVAGTPGSWTVTVLDGATTIGTGTIQFASGQPVAGSSTVAVTYTPTGQSPVPFTLDFSGDVTSSGTGTVSTLAMDSQDGWGFGGLTKATFDEGGTLVLDYSNGQTVRGARLALGRFSSPEAVRSAGGNTFEVVDASAWQAGAAQEQGFGAIRAGMVEMSNVDLSQQFSDLVIMQRGYQASSQIVSTEKEMIDTLFAMAGK